MLAVFVISLSIILALLGCGGDETTTTTSPIATSPTTTTTSPTMTETTTTTEPTETTTTTEPTETTTTSPSVEPDIVDIAIDDGRFTTLVAALQAADLVDTLKGEGPFTVFAPTDDAFAKLPEGTVESLLDDIPTLTDILLYHVVAGKIMAADFMELDSVETLLMEPVDITIMDSTVMINDAEVIIPDIEASNGVIHVIDTVLLPPEDTTPTADLGSVEVLGVWGGSELESFQAMVAPWEEQTGGTMEFTGTRDLTAILTTRVQAGNPPDVAILPNPGLMKQYVDSADLQPLNEILDMTRISQEFGQAWIDLGTVDGNLYAIFMKAANKGMIWYDPTTFTDNGWTVPTTWDELITLSDDIVAAGGTPPAPWAMGVESGAATGWAGTDWIAQIFLEQNGGDAYDQWVAHEIPWTDQRIKEAWEMWGSIVTTEGYIPGGATTVLATNFQDASYWPFDTPPQAAMYYEGDFVQGFITSQFPDAVAGTDYDFFPFPTINPDYAGAVTGGADLVVVFNDTPTVRSFVDYLSTADAQQIWVERGGFTSVNNQVPMNVYPDEIAQKSAEQLLNASLFRFGAGDSMPAAMQTTWWTGIQNYLQDPTSLDSILEDLEAAAATAYSTTETTTTTTS
jgi:alpha-glucoside transport system substrate-binding protein